MALSDLFEVNPKRAIEKRSESTFVSMADLAEHQRRIVSWTKRPFKSGSRFQNGDVLVARITPCLENGKTAFVDILDEEAFGHGSTEFIVLAARDGVADPLFGYYLATSPRFRDYAISRMIGSSGRQRVSAGEIGEYELEYVPTLEEQRAIAEVLGSLDDRIEWAQALSSLLLETTRTHYRLRCQVSSRSVPIGDWAAVHFGAPYDSTQFSMKGIGKPLIRIRDIGALDASVYTTETHRADVQIAPGDIVVGMDGEFRAHLWRGPRAVLNQRVCTFRPVEPNGTVDLLHALEEPLKVSEASISGTTVSHLGKRHIDDFVLVMPSDPSGALEEVAATIGLLGSEIRMLTEIRQALLPPLISGDVRVEKPERLVGQP